MNDPKMTGIRCSMAAAAVLMTCAGASAQAVTEDSWNLTPFLGVVFGGNVENAPATGGVALGYGGRGLGVEGNSRTSRQNRVS